MAFGKHQAVSHSVGGKIKSTRRHMLAVAAMAGCAAVATQHAPAATYNWARGIGGTFSWSNTGTEANDNGNDWNTTPAGQYPQLAGDVANIFNATSANQIINLEANTVVGTINFGNATGYQDIRNLSSGTSGPFTLTLNNSTSDAGISQLSANSSANLLVAISVAGNGNLDFSGTSTAASNISGGISSAVTTGSVNFQSGIWNVNSAIGNGSGTTSLNVQGGTVTLNGAGSNTFTGSTTIGFASGGTVALVPTLVENFANATTATNLINSSSPLVMGNGTLQVIQQNNTASSQTFNGLTLNPGAAEIIGTSAGTGGLNISLGAITRTTGGTVDFTLPTTGNISTTNTNTNGIIGGWATVGDSGTASGDWAAVGTNGIVAYTGYTLVSAAASSTLTLNSGTGTLNYKTGVLNGTNYITTISGSGTVNSLVVQGDTSVPSGSTLTIGSGGLMLKGTQRWITNNGVGSNTGTGVINSGATSGELFVDVPSASATNWTIWPKITDNGATPTVLVKDGPGTVFLGNFDTFTGGTIVNQGTLALSANNSPNAGTGTIRGTVTINPGATLLIQATAQASGNTAPTNAFGYSAGSEVTTVNIYGGTLNDNFAGDQGYNQNYNLSGGTIESNAGVSSASATQYMIIADGATVNVLPNANPSVIAGRVFSRTADVTTYNVSAGSASPNLLVSAAVTGSDVLLKTGPGTMQFTGANTFTGGLTVNGGTVTEPSGSWATGTGNIVLGSTSGASGAYVVSGATITGATSGDQIKIGNAAGAYGYFNMASGTVTANEIDLGGIDGGGTGVMDTTAGTVNVTGWFLPTRASGATSILNMNGGTINYSGPAGQIGFNLPYGNTGVNDYGVLNIGGTFNASGANFNEMFGAAASSVSIVNLRSGGTLQVQSFINSTATGLSQLNFDGGTLKAGTANAAFLAASNYSGGVYIQAAGGTIDNNGVNITVNSPLQAPSQNGLSSVALTSGGSGYIGAPAVVISGGGGTGATAVAQVNNGVVTGIIVTNPGTGYTGTPTITLSGGGYTSAASIGTVNTATAVSGGISFAGAGTTTISGINTYTGQTNVVAGTAIAGIASTGAGGPFGYNSVLNVGSGAIASTGSFNVSVGGLSGAGTVTGSGAFTIQNTPGTPAAFAGTISSTGPFVVGSAGVLTLSSAATLSPTSLLVSVANSGSLNLQGGSTVSNLSNSGLVTLSTATSIVNLNGATTGVVNTSGNVLTVTGTGTYQGAIADGSTAGGGLTVSGGNLTLRGTSTYTGPTSVTTGGTLLLDGSGSNTGALGNTAVSVVGSTSQLSVKGNASIGGSLSSNGIINLQDLGVNSLNISGPLHLTGTGGGSVNLDLGSSSSDSINATGIATLSGITTLNFDLVPGASLSNGTTYTLMTASGGLSASRFNASPEFPVGFTNLSLSNNSTGTALLLTVSGNAFLNGTEYWTGQASIAASDPANQWGDAAGSTSNWSTDSAGLNPYLQVPGSSTDVVFTASNATGVTGALSTEMDGGYSIRSLTFAVPSATGITSSTLNTNFNVLSIGSGGLTLSSTSNSGATINGGGSILLIGSQSWANNTALPLNVSTGISAASNGTVLTVNGTGTGGVVLGPVTDGAGTVSLVLNQAGTTTLSGNDSASGGLTVQSGTVVANGNDTFGSLAISSGSLTLGGANSITGGISITGGVVHLGNAAALSAATSPTTLTFGSAGDLQLNGNNSAVKDLTGSGAATVENASATAATFSDNLTGNDTWAGTLQDGTGGGKLSTVINGAGVLTLTGSNTYTGSTTISGGATVQISQASNLSASPIVLNNGTLESTGGTYNLSSAQTVTLTGAGKLQVDGGGLTIPANIALGASSLAITGGGNVNLPGNISSTSTAGGLNISNSGIVTINGSNSYTGTTIINNGSGLVQITGGTLGSLGTSNIPDIQLATTSSQSASLSISGGTINADRFIVAGNAANTDGGNASVVQTGGIVNASQWVTVGSGSVGGTSSATGVYNISGGSLNVNLAGGTNLEVGNFAGTIGTVYVGGSGAINIYNSGNISLLANGAAGGFVFQSGGTVTFYSNNGTTPGGTGALIVGNAGASGNAVYELDGGTLAVPSITHTGGVGTFRFNGGLLTAESSSANFINNLNNAYVEAGGAIINVPAGLSPTIPQALVHDASAGSADGGLTLQGAGTLTLTSTANSYAGPTTVTGGTLRLVGSSAPVLDYVFNSNTVSGTTVTNLGTGGSALNGTLGGTGGSFTTTGGPLGNGSVNFTGTSSLAVASGITSLANTSNWTISMWVNTSNTSGGALLYKGDGTHWYYGNTTYYLAGSTPTAVRSSGGFITGTASTVPSSSWHMVTYTESAGTTTIYVDGVATTTTNGWNNTPDVGTSVLFGNTPDPYDAGAFNLNGSIGNINVYSTGLTGAQVASLYTSNQIVSPSTSNILPAGNPVSLTTSTASLDLEAVSQTVGSLNGVSGSSVILGNGSILTITNATNSEFDGTVTGTGGLTVTNSGTFKLGGVANYSGATLVTSGATLDASAANVTTGSLVVDSSSTLNLAIGNALAVTGSASFAGTLNLSTGTPTTSPEVLISYGSYTGNFASYNIPTGDSLLYTPTALELISVTGPSNLVWSNGAGTGVWDTATKNWNSSGTAVTYSDNSNTSTGDVVVFNDSNGGGYNVTINNSGGSVHPTSVTFNASGNYNISGAAAGIGIAGTGSVTLTGTGTVTFTSTNSYTGGTNGIGRGLPG
jgi:autotransporter-associated beta strand protein